MPTITLGARKHAQDWVGRCDDEAVRVMGVSPRTITLALSDEALEEFISDAIYYAEAKDCPAAAACLRALRRAGVVWEWRTDGGSYYTVKLVRDD